MKDNSKWRKNLQKGRETIYGGVEGKANFKKNGDVSHTCNKFPQ